MCELLSKVEDLKQVLQRCSKIIEADPTNPSFGDRSDKEIASLTQKYLWSSSLAANNYIMHLIVFPPQSAEFQTYKPSY